MQQDPDVAGIYATLGWGRAEVVEGPPANPLLVIAVKDNFEAMGVKASAPNCHFVRGVLAGSLSILSGASMSCSEVECIAMGAPACKFVLTS